jgi:hypothetical protein
MSSLRLYIGESFDRPAWASVVIRHPAGLLASACHPLLDHRVRLIVVGLAHAALGIGQAEGNLNRRPAQAGQQALVDHWFLAAPSTTGRTAFGIVNPSNSATTGS